nr:hypothetical protein [Tanacetum cinerariifolium]
TSADKSDSKPIEYASSDSDSNVEPSTSVPEPIVNESKVVSEPKAVCKPKVWTDASIIEEYETDSDDDLVFNVQEDKEKPSCAFTDSIKHVNTARENIKEKGTPNHCPKIKKQDRHSHIKVQPKDKGKGILIEEPKPLKGQEQIEQDEAFARQLEAELNANINWNDVIEQVKKSDRQNNFAFTNEIEKLKARVHKLEEENKILKEKSFKSAKINAATPVEDREESFKQGRMIADMNEDDIDEEEPAEVEEVFEIVIAAKLITEVVATAEPTTTAAQVPKASAPMRTRGVVIQDPEETAASVIVHTKLEAELNANINWNDAIEQVKKSERQNSAVMRYQALKRKPLTEGQAMKNMMIYLKNMAGFKMNFFKGMTYSKIRPLFEKHYNSNQAFLERVTEKVTVQEKEIKEEGNKRQGESLENDIAKKQRMDEEADELKRHLQIVANDDDDVYTEATPLASKAPVVDYQIHHENNKPYYKIISTYGTHKLFLSFITLLKNFYREDLETLWKLVKERFEITEPKNFSDDFLLNILKIMFEKPNIEANVWKDQKGRYGLAKVKSWKLFESCGVHIITLTTTQMFLLVEKKYPLTHFTLEQMLNNVRLEVKEESEMSLELLRLVRRQLNKGYVPE